MGMSMMVMKAGSASAACSHLMRTTFIIISAPTVIRAGPMAYGGTLAAPTQNTSASAWSQRNMHAWMSFMMLILKRLALCAMFLRHNDIPKLPCSVMGEQIHMQSTAHMSSDTSGIWLFAMLLVGEVLSLHTVWAQMAMATQGVRKLMGGQGNSHRTGPKKRDTKNQSDTVRAVRPVLQRSSTRSQRK